MQIKTTMRYQYTISVAKRNTATTSSADKDMRSWTTYTLLMRTNGQPLWKQFGGFLQNLTCKHHITQILPSWALVPVKQNLHPCKHCTQTFIVVLFVVAKNWTQPICFSMGNWLNRLGDIHSVNSYAAMNRNCGYSGQPG